MLGLPKATKMEQTASEKSNLCKISNEYSCKEKIDADISRITIVNEITPNKVNIPAGDEVKKFFVLLNLKKKRV